MQCFGAESTVMLHKIGKIWARVVCPMCMNQQPGATAMLIVVIATGRLLSAHLPLRGVKHLQNVRCRLLGRGGQRSLHHACWWPSPWRRGCCWRGAAKGSSETCCGCCCGAEDSFTGVAGAPAANGSAPSLACAGAAALLCTKQSKHCWYSSDLSCHVLQIVRCNTLTSSVFVPLQGLQHHGQPGPFQHEAVQSLEEQARGVRQVALRGKVHLESIQWSSEVSTAGCSAPEAGAGGLAASMKAAQLSSSGVAAAGAAGSVALAAGAVLAAGGVCRRGFSMSSRF